MDARSSASSARYSGLSNPSRACDSWTRIPMKLSAPLLRTFLSLAFLSALVAAPVRAEPVPESDIVTRKARVGEIPILVIAPKETRGRHLVIWLPGFSGTKEGSERQFRDLAARGYVGLSFDPYQHGERRIEPQPELVSRVRGNIRRYFWPILARTAEEVTPVIDWAIRELGVKPEVGMGGISMGGDISVAAAGADPRIRVVSAVVATPDWMRPGSFEPPGMPDEAAQAAYNRRNPMTHLEAYRHRPFIAFQSGAVDRQVPPDAGERFVAALKKKIYRGYEDRLQVNLLPDTPHAYTPPMWENSVKWFEAHLK